MTMKVALDLIPKETINDYADIQCAIFGDILVKALGINGGCTLFRRSKHVDCYILAWTTDDGEVYDGRFDLDTIMRSLKGKSMSLTMDVYTRK